jgi:RNA polymerase sigma-70 factor, ECF subfamily
MPDLAADDTRTTLLLSMLSTPSAEGAWRIFLGRYWPRIVEWARRQGAGLDDAELIASQVVLKLACGRALTSFDRGRGRFRPWLRAVVRRVALDFRRKVQETPGGVGLGSGDADPLDALLDPASLDGLADALDAQLSHDLREAEAVIERVRARVKSSSWEAYYRTAILGDDAVETADALGLSVRAVYMAKRRVGQMLEEEGRAALG